MPSMAGLKTRNMPLSTRRSFTRGTPRGLFGKNGWWQPFTIGRFGAHDSSPWFRSLDHG